MESGWQKRGLFWMPESTVHTPTHREKREPFYGRTVLPLAKRLLQAQGMEVTLSGVENILADGPALLAINHTGYYDFILAGIFAYVRGGRLVRFMAKKEIFDVPVIGAIMRGMRHISVDRQAGSAALDQAVRSLNAGNLVGIFPEGTISRSFEIQDLKTGAARIAQGADAPLIPVAIWGSQRIWTKGLPKNLGRSFIPVMLRAGEPIDTSGSAEEVTARLKAAMETLLEDVRNDYEQRYGPFKGGEPWRPVSRGGTAPTIEEAKAIDAQVRAERAAKKAAQQAERAAKKAAQGGAAPLHKRLLRKLQQLRR